MTFKSPFGVAKSQFAVISVIEPVEADLHALARVVNAILPITRSSLLHAWSGKKKPWVARYSTSGREVRLTAPSCTHGNHPRSVRQPTSPPSGGMVGMPSPVRRVTAPGPPNGPTVAAYGRGAIHGTNRPPAGVYVRPPHGFSRTPCTSFRVPNDVTLSSTTVDDYDMLRLT